MTQADLTSSADPETPVDLAIRPIVPADLERLTEICLLTADSGEDATGLYSDRRYPGLIWVLPYAVLEPDLAFVLVSRDETLGYVVGTADTARFQARLDDEWWPCIRREVDGRTPERPADARVLELIAQPERAETGPPLDRYPAHLHINIMPAAQGAGWGRRLIGHESDALQRAGAPGVHLGVSLQNLKATAFYERLGFKRLMVTKSALIMARSLV